MTRPLRVPADGFGGAALYKCRTTHVRTVPLRNVFTYRTYLWLADPDDLPHPGRPFRLLAGFRARDHMGDRHRTIRETSAGSSQRAACAWTGGRCQPSHQARLAGKTFPRRAKSAERRRSQLHGRP